ncbi:hypothetical protein DFH29DRAFT_1000035 [Suillus ampliporus]|nr:hypothetical protein DFH29DRAFT_1000035 [Suillus ampliporus]
MDNNQAGSGVVVVKGTNITSIFVKQMLAPESLIPTVLSTSPTFGRGTIRKFSNNASGMKKLAARDFEDLLQCAIPVFEHLLPEPFNALVLDLLFELATWHGLAKLCLHTDTTLSFLDTSTTRLGKILRCFASETEKEFDTRDLPSEEAAHGHCKARTAAQGLARGTQDSAKHQLQGRSKHRKFNLQTYKLHALGDYVSTIKQFGTTDNFSTLLGELEHRRQVMEVDAADTPFLRFEVSEQLPYTDPQAHYHMSSEVRHYLSLSQWSRKYAGDPAFVDFLPQLQDHILARLLGRNYDGDESSFSSAERSRLTFINDRIYRHKVIRINYTTYDLRQDQDSLNPRIHVDVMVLSHKDDEANSHPYWYARIIGAFHALVYYRDPASNPSSYDPVQVDFAWAGKRNGYIDSASYLAKIPERLDSLIQKILSAEFILSQLLHLAIPRNICRRQSSAILVTTTKTGHISTLNMFVDRDTLMRFRGGGVGHRTTREATDGFVSDRDPLDMCHAGTTVFSNENEGAEHDKCDPVDCMGESTAQGEAIELPVDESQPDSDDDYGYSGIQQEVEGEDDDSNDGEEEKENNAIEGNEGDEIDDELGAEDGEDSDEELEGFSKF